MYRQFMSTGGVKVSVCSQLVSTKICPLRTRPETGAFV